MTSSPDDEPIEVSSPVCYAHEFADYARPPRLPAAELAAFLNVLLESERAGARVLARWCHDVAPIRWRRCATTRPATAPG